MEYSEQHHYTTNEFQALAQQSKDAPPPTQRDVKSKITSFRLLRTSFVFQTKEFFNNSTLHGVRYIAETDRPFGERFMWFCFTMIGFISALVIIVSLWEKFQTNPTITGLDMDVHNQQLVFPTVAVCPTESFDINRTSELAYNMLGNKEEDSIEVFAPFLIYLPQLSYTTLKTANQFTGNITANKNKANIDEKTLRYLSFQISVNCGDVFDRCKYRDENISCCDYFHPVYSEHGFCYAFNPRFIDESNKEKMNSGFHELFETDKKWALNFMPKQEANIFIFSNLENFGYDFRPYVICEPTYTTELLITMKQTYTTEDARQLSIGQRKCIFQDELKLEYYEGGYTFTSCMKECRIKKCIKYCGCVPPFYGPMKNLKYCGIDKFKCLADHVEQITNIRDCRRCELSCANTVYEIEKLTKTATNMVEKFVNIEYLTWPIIRYKREVLFGWVDLLVSFGGIAGLFLGFSLLSGVEIIYYFTMRTCCMLYKNRKELYEIEEKKLTTPQEHIDLSLTLMRRTNSAPATISSNGFAAQPAVRQIDVAELSSSVQNQQDQAETSDFQPTNRFPHLTRVAKKMHNFRQLNQIETSYDYANKTGPYYMP